MVVMKVAIVTVVMLTVVEVEGMKMVVRGMEGRRCN